MESCPTQAVLPLVGLATEKVIGDRYSTCYRNVLDWLGRLNKIGSQLAPPNPSAVMASGRVVCPLLLP
ncbi:MAG: hypothetical protein ACQESR_05605 [Planctomycetota bacterium]